MCKCGWKYENSPARPLLCTVNKDLHKIYLNYNGHINNSNKTEKTENNCISGSKFAIVISTICCSSQKLFVIFFFYFAFSPYLLLQMIMMLLSILVCSCCCCYSCLPLLKYCLHSSNKCSNISFYYFFAKKYKEIHYDVDVDEDFNVEMQKNLG